MSDFTAKARAYTDNEIRYALADIKSTLALHLDKPTDDPYVAKLYREWDALLAEGAKRWTRKGRGRRM